MTLPIWRDKIAAQIAAAQAGKRAAAARLTADKSAWPWTSLCGAYDYREGTRNLALLQNQLIPKARNSLELARAGYLSGQVDFFNLIDAERALLNFQLQEIQERTRREISLANLSLLIAGVPPENAPVLEARNAGAKNDKELQTGTTQFRNREHTPPACDLRRRAANFVASSLFTSNM